MNVQNAILPFFFILTAGVLCRWVPNIPAIESIRKSINSVIIWFFLPALQFNVMAHQHFDGDMALIPTVALTSLAINLVTTFLLLKAVMPFTKIKPSTVGSIFLCSCWGNITFIGLPLLTSLFGTNGSKVAILFDVFALGPTIFILGSVIGKLVHSSKNWIGRIKDARNGLYQYLKLPPFWFACGGSVISLLHIELPNVLTTSFEMMAKGVTPLVLFSIGLTLSVPKNRKEMAAAGPLVLVSFIKLFLSPLAAFYGLVFFKNYLFKSYILTHDIALSIVLESAMPSMAASLIIAEITSMDLQFTAQAITFTTLVSPFSLTFIHSLLSKYFEQI